MEKEKPNFEAGETEKFFSERFNRYFENTILDTFVQDNGIRCEDRYGDKGWIVGKHSAIKTDRREIEGWFWVIRDRDNALIGIHKEMLEWKYTTTRTTN